MLFSIMNVEVLFTFVLIYQTATLDVNPVSLQSKDLNRGDLCITPNDENATCVLFRDCEILTKAVSTFHPDAVKFAQDSQCGYDKGGLVCCGSSAFPKVNVDLLFTPRPTINFTPAPQLDKISLSSFSDETICGLEANPSYRIKGGKITQFDESPWLVALEYLSKYDNTNAGIRCGGSLINDRFVLTAAHCIVHIEFVVIKAWLGVTNITSNENCLNLTGKLQCVNSTRILNIDREIPHELYDSANGYNDIGLLRLEREIEFTNYIRPICLPLPETPSPPIGIRTMVAGWGFTEDHVPSKIKLKVDIPVQNDSICNKILEMEERQVSSGQLCAGGEKGKDSCQGDSGGPLTVDFRNMNQKTQWYQEGIVSYGVGCGIQGRPAVYTKVSRYVAWIITNTDVLQVYHYRSGGGCGRFEEDYLNCHFW